MIYSKSECIDFFSFLGVMDKYTKIIPALLHFMAMHQVQLLFNMISEQAYDIA